MKRDTRKFVLRMKFHRLPSATIPMIPATTRPARTPGVAAALAMSRIAPMRRIVRQASPNSNLRLKSMLLHSAVERAARQAELGSGERYVEMMQSQRALDHLFFQLVEVEAVADYRQRRRLGAQRQRKIVDVVA